MVSKNPVVDALATYPAEALYAKKRALQARGLDVFDFSVGDPIEPTDEGIVSAFKDGVPPISQYPTIAGEQPFREACCRWVSRRFGVDLDPATQVIPSSGSKESIFHLPLTFIDRDSPRRRVVFGTPGYPVYERGTLFAGGIPHPVELTAEQRYLLEPWRLPEDVLAEVAIIWTNYPHNPTGQLADREYLERLAIFCREREILLCCDECYVDFYLDEEKPLSILEVAGTDGLLTFNSLSKRSGMTGYRSGFIAGDAELIGLLKKTRANFGVASTRVVQHAAVHAWNDESHVEARRAIFRQKRDVFCALFDELGIRYLPATATLYLWVETPPGTEAMAYAERLADAGILVSPASMFGVDQPYIRLALVPSVEDCQRAAERWRGKIT